MCAACVTLVFLQHFEISQAEYNELCGKRVTCYPKGTLGAAGHILRADKVCHVFGCALVDVEDGEDGEDGDAPCQYHANVGYSC